MYKVFGYTCFCEDFEFETNSFMEAVRFFRDRERALCVCFIKGVSQKVERRL